MKKVEFEEETFARERQGVDRARRGEGTKTRMQSEF